MNVISGRRFCKTALIINFPLIVFLPVLVIFSSVNAQDITVNNNLNFGAIFPGVPKTVSKNTAGEAAEFYIAGTAGAEVSLDFALPPYMYTTGDNMQLIFTSTDCAVDSSANPDQANPLQNNLNPRHSIMARIGSNGLTVWLGGQVVPEMNQKPGGYSASIVLTVSYTGN